MHHTTDETQDQREPLFNDGRLITSLWALKLRQLTVLEAELLRAEQHLRLIDDELLVDRLDRVRELVRAELHRRQFGGDGAYDSAIAWRGLYRSNRT